MLILAVLSIALVPAYVLGECPDVTELPVLFDDNTFLCAEAWQGPGGSSAIQVGSNKNT